VCRSHRRQGHLFERFEDEWAASQDWKASSRQSWPAHRSRLAARTVGQPLEKIDRLALQKLQTDLGRTYSPSTTETTMSYARSIMRSAFVNGRIGRDPTVGLKPPKARDGDRDGKVTPEMLPTRAAALAILDATPRPFRAATALGLAGLRIGEVLGMSADRLQLEHRKVTVDRQLQRIARENVLTTPKAEKTRVVVVPSLVAVELRRHLRDHQGEGLLFRGGRGALLRRVMF
jgi:integrase